MRPNSSRHVQGSQIRLGRSLDSSHRVGTLQRCPKKVTVIILATCTQPSPKPKASQVIGSSLQAYRKLINMSPKVFEPIPPGKANLRKRELPLHPRPLTHNHNNSDVSPHYSTRHLRAACAQCGPHSSRHVQGSQIRLGRSLESSHRVGTLQRCPKKVTVIILATCTQPSPRPKASQVQQPSSCVHRELIASLSEAYQHVTQSL